MEQSKKNRAIAAELIAKAMQDLAFRKAFIDNPKAMLQKAGAEIEDAVEVRIVENTETLRHIVLPPIPSGVADLSDDQLAAVAGGAGASSQTADVEAVVVVVGPTIAVVSGPVNPAGAIVVI